MDELRVNQTQLARIFRVTTRTIQRWHEDGLPREGEGPTTTYDLSEVVVWALERERGKFEPADEDYEKALARKTAAQAELAEIEVAERRGQLIDIDDVEQLVRGPLEQVDAALRNAPSRYAPDLAAAAKLKGGIRRAARMLEDIVERIREDLRRMGEDGDGPGAAAA